MKSQFFSKPVMLFSCLWVSILSLSPVTTQAGSIFVPREQYYNGYRDYNRNQGRSSYNSNSRRQNRALNFYYGGNRNRYIDYNRGYQSNDRYCPDDSYSDYRDRGRRSYQRPRGFGIFYYGKQR